MSRYVKVALLSSIAFVLASMMPRSAAAQDDSSYQNQVHNLLMRGALKRDAVNHNFQAPNDWYRYGYIRIGNGNYQTTTFHLEAGYVYRFVGACDSDCSDLDFELRDEASDRIIAKDTDPDDTPAVQIEPIRSGDYTIIAKIPSCHAFAGCYWAVQALWK